MPNFIDKLSNIDRYRQTITIIVSSLIVLSITSLSLSWPPATQLASSTLHKYWKLPIIEEEERPVFSWWTRRWRLKAPMAARCSTRQNLVGVEQKNIGPHFLQWFMNKTILPPSPEDGTLRCDQQGETVRIRQPYNTKAEWTNNRNIGKCCHSPSKFRM